MSNIATDQLRALFLGAAPEREAELERLWNQYSPVIQIVPDEHEGQSLVMQAGLYKWVQFNHRILRAIWLLSFSAWEGYIAIHEAATTPGPDQAFERFKTTLKCAVTICEAEHAESIPFPAGIPEPGALVAHEPGSYARVAGELAIFAAGWAFLHEIRHLMHQQEGTSGGDTPEERHAEELSCDEFASGFLLEKVGDYAASNGVPEAKVALKRQIGIHFAMYALTVLGRRNWGDSTTHPAIQRRIDRALTAMDQFGFSKGAAVIASASFAALLEVFPQAPAPLVAIAERAAAENWADSSFTDIGIG